MTQEEGSRRTKHKTMVRSASCRRLLPDVFLLVAVPGAVTYCFGDAVDGVVLEGWPFRAVSLLFDGFLNENRGGWVGSPLFCASSSWTLPPVSLTFPGVQAPSDSALLNGEFCALLPFENILGSTSATFLVAPILK